MVEVNGMRKPRMPSKVGLPEEETSARDVGSGEHQSYLVALRGRPWPRWAGRRVAHTGRS